jgi:hypothetical protein
VTGFFYDILNASDELVRWWPSPASGLDEAVAGLGGVALDAGERVRLFDNASSAPLAVRSHDGLVEVLS